MAKSHSFPAVVMAADADQAVARVARQAAKCPGFSVSGEVQVRSAKHMMWSVEVVHDGSGNVNDAWVVFSSFGVSPDESMGSRWQSVAGVGC